MAVRVHLVSVRPTMRLARPVFDPEGKLVAGAGTVLRDAVLRGLRRMAVQTVLVEDDGVASWDAVRPLEEELAELDARFGSVGAADPLGALKAAIRRRLTARAARLADEAGEG